MEHGSRVTSAVGIAKVKLRINHRMHCLRRSPQLISKKKRSCFRMRIGFLLKKQSVRIAKFEDGRSTPLAFGLTTSMLSSRQADINRTKLQGNSRRGARESFNQVIRSDPGSGLKVPAAVGSMVIMGWKKLLSTLWTRRIVKAQSLIEAIRAHKYKHDAQASG